MPDSPVCLHFDAGEGAHFSLEASVASSFLFRHLSRREKVDVLQAFQQVPIKVCTCGYRQLPQKFTQDAPLYIKGASGCITAYLARYRLCQSAKYLQASHCYWVSVQLIHPAAT